MFERFKKETIVIHEFEFVPQFDYEHCTKEELTTFLKTLSRPQLLHLGDTLDFDAIETKLDLWDIYYSVISWHGVWPLDDDASKALNILYWNKDSLYNTTKGLLEKVNGMQKKLDKIETLIANAEFKLCGKDALKL